MSDIFPNRQFFDECPLGVIAVADDGRKFEILYANTAIRETAGDFKTGSGLADISSGKSDSDIVRLLLQDPLPSSHTLQFDDRWLKLNFQKIRWQDRNCILIFIDNITTIKKSEERLQKAVAQADALAEQKSNFLATMSHEMRTPMQAVFGVLELIEHENPSASILNMVNIAKVSAAGLIEILDDILDLAKIDADKMELDVFEVPVRTLVRGVLEALAVKLHDKAVVLKDDIGDDVPFVISGDPKRLRQILINLTGNALKFTHEGSVTVRVRALPDAGLAGAPGLRFEVIDTGIGIGEEARGRLFGTFAQADNTTARKFGGTGLGLSICKKLVTLMGGRIGVDSHEGTGSVFWFEIPAPEIDSAAQSLDMPDLKGISVLSVEDHPQAAKEIVNSLRSMGAIVDSCGTCAQAAALARRKPFDVCVIDQGLPDGLGVDLIRELIDIRPNMGMFMYTVRNDSGLQQTLQTLGIKYVAKPASRIGLGYAVFETAARTSHVNAAETRRLLIAEDTESVRDLLKRQLDILGCEADFVENGRQAAAALSAQEYGLVFTDLHMPEMDGYQLVEHIRRAEEKTGRHLPVIVITADVQMMERQVYLEHGFDECLLKPASIGHFRRLLVRWGMIEKENAPAAVRTGPETGEASAIDISMLAEQMGAFDDVAREMLGLFPEKIKPVFEKLKFSLQKRDLPSAAAAAHSLKGAALSAGARKLGSIASQIQDDAEKNIIAPDALALLESEFDRVCGAIRDIGKN